MILERLDYILMKQMDIVNQIRTIKEKTEKNEKVEHMGYLPDWFTPKDLINFHKDRYNILDIAKNYNEQRIREWIMAARKRPNRDFRTDAEIELLRGCINEN